MSTTSVLDLWSDDIRADVLTPATILHAQVDALSRKADGLLRAELRSEFNQEKAEHSLDLIAPALNDYRITLLKTWHDTQLVYPAKVKSRGLLPPPVPRGHIAMPSQLWPLQDDDDVEPDEKLASSQGEYIAIVGNILKSGWVRSLLQSLIARSNEVLIEKSRQNGSHGGSESDVN